MRRRHVLLIVLGAAVLRAGLLGVPDLMPQSAYYSIYGTHPSLSYYDHPPMIGWLLWGAFHLLGKSALTVRLTVFATTLLVQLAFLALARRMLGREDSAFSALALFSTTGMATVLSIMAIPDVPLLLWWIVSLWCLHEVLFGGRRSLGWWALAGVSMGLALLSKYTAVYLQVGLVLFLLTAPPFRRLLRSPGPWISLGVAHVVALPIYVWNARHGWASFAFQSVDRVASEARGLDLGGALGFLASQSLWLLPVLWFGLLWIATRDTSKVLRSPRRLDRLDGGATSERDERLFLLAFAVPVLVTCLALSVVVWVKANWATPAYATGVLLVAREWKRRLVSWHLATSAVFHVALAVQLVWYPVVIQSDDTWFGWQEAARRIERRVEDLSASHPDLFVFSSDNYKTTAELRFYTDLEAYGMNVIGWNARQLAFLGEDPHDLVGRDALYVRSESRLRPSDKTNRYVARTREYFERVRELEPIEVRHRGRMARLFRIFLCEGYRGPDDARTSEENDAGTRPIGTSATDS